MRALYRDDVTVSPALAGASLSSVERQTLDRLVKLLEHEMGAGLHAVWLYGSRARGERPSEESDIDLLVVAEGGWDRLRGRPIDLVYLAAEETGGNPVSFSVKVLSPEEVAHDREIQAFFMQEVDRDKIVLFGAA